MPFEICVRKGKTLGIMTAFNQINGVYCAGNNHVLTDILKYDYGFTGYTLSDWGSIRPVATNVAANAGQDVELITVLKFGTTPLGSAVNSGLVSKARLDDMARRIVRNKAFSEVYNKPFNFRQYSAEFGGAVHKAACLELGQKSIVLAKNTNNVLPLDPNTIKSVALLGPWADSSKVRVSGGGSGNANCLNHNNRVSWYKGISDRIGSSKVMYRPSSWQNAEVVIVFVGVNGETENTDRPLLGIASSTDPAVSDAESSTLVQQVVAAKKKCIVVFTGGTAAKKEGWADADAILVAWYPGESQGKALAQILFGDVNPSGKLSSSWPMNESSLPAWKPTSLQHQYPSVDTGIGYMWYDRTGKAPFMAFGHGLSYTTFAYSNIRLSQTMAMVGEDITATVTVMNTGSRDGDEIAQLYLSETAPAMPRPVKVLRGFAKVSLKKGESKDVSFLLRPRDFAYFNDNIKPPRFIVQADTYTIRVGPSSINLPLSATVTLK
jgi:beta-glucosidase